MMAPLCATAVHLMLQSWAPPAGTAYTLDAVLTKGSCISEENILPHPSLQPTKA